MEKLSITFRLESDKVAFLDDLAKALDRDRSYLIKEAVDSYLALHRWQIEEIHKAIAEANAGDFLSDEEANAFMAELGR